MRAGFGERKDRVGGVRRTSAADVQRRKPAPPEKTHAEEYYYIKQMNARTPMLIALEGGEVLRGWIEWYDRDCIKVNRTDGPNLLVYKRCVRYVCKDDEAQPET